MQEEATWLTELRTQIRKRLDPWVVLEGRHAVEAAVAGWWDVQGVVASRESEWDLPDWSGLEVMRRSREEMKEVAGYPFHRGVLGLARQPDEVADVAGLMEELPDDAMIVVCPKLTDAANAGAIVRNAAALGAQAVIFGEEGVSPFDRKAVRASAGALFRIPVRVADGGLILRCLKAGDFSMVGATVDKEERGLEVADFCDGRLALLIGSEEDGLGSFWLKACDQLHWITMASEVDSLNTAAASAIFLWEISRFRGEEDDVF